MTRKEQHDAMREFCRRVLQASWDGDVDSGDVSDWGLELGLIYSDKANKRDLQETSFEGDIGDPIYRMEDWLLVPSPADGIDGHAHIPKS